MKKEKKTTFRKKMSTVLWAYGQAWKIRKGILILWLGVSVLLSVLPAISLYFNRQITEGLSRYLSSGAGNYSDIIGHVFYLGIVMLLIGLSARLNEDLIFMMMYDSYSVGMQEIMMDRLQKIPMIDLLGREWNDEYNYIIYRAGSLTGLMSSSCTMIGKLVSMVSLLFVAFQTSRAIFLFSFLYVVLILAVNLTYTEKVRLDRHILEKDTRAAEYFEKLPFQPDSAKELRIFENTDYIIEQWKKFYGRILKVEEKRAAGIEWRSFISSGGFYLFLMAAMLYLLGQIAEGTLTVSAFLLIYSLCFSLYTAISGLARSMLRFDYGLYALERQAHFLIQAPTYPAVSAAQEGQWEDGKTSSGKQEETPVFQLRDVSFSYNREKEVLHHIDLEIYKGETIAIVGENGSGKTTLSKLLLGMYEPTEGQMLLYGKPYRQYSLDDIRKRIGIFFQDFCILHAPVRENVAYGDIRYLDDDQKILEAMERGGAARFLQRLPGGLETVLGKKVDSNGIQLSGGQQACVAVSRAHMNEKEILILDEPAAALDPIAELEQFHHMKDKMENRTAILISHRVGFARMADRIIMMDHGVIAEMGTHEELIQKGGLYAHFFQEQAQWYQN